jgi:hypothetical protein
MPTPSAPKKPKAAHKHPEPKVQPKAPKAPKRPVEKPADKQVFHDWAMF